MLPVHEDSWESSISQANVGEGQTVQKLQEGHRANRHKSHLLVSVCEVSLFVQHSYRFFFFMSWSYDKIVVVLLSGWFCLFCLITCYLMAYISTEHLLCCTSGWWFWKCSWHHPLWEVLDGSRLYWLLLLSYLHWILFVCFGLCFCLFCFSSLFLFLVYMVSEYRVNMCICLQNPSLPGKG